MKQCRIEEQKEKEKENKKEEEIMDKLGMKKE